MIIYSKSSLNNSAIGRLETPIKMVIEHESDVITRSGGVCDALFNVEKSNRFGETILGTSEFDVFRATEDGSSAELDNIRETYSKFIEHIQYMKEFVITAQMMEDANFGISADAKRRAEAFTRAYYKTMNKLCEFALANGFYVSANFAGSPLDLSTPDKLPLFSKEHKWGNNGGTQSNCFIGPIVTENADGVTYSSAVFSKALSALSIKIRNMLDENGEPLGYTADTIILPGNNPQLEAIARTVCGSQFVTGSNYNDINLNYGCWRIVVLPTWKPEFDSIMVMSSEANKNLCGNMFFNRVPLTVTNWVDNHTGNYIWNGRCRFGVGFGTYKHIALAMDLSSHEYASELF